MKAIVTKKAGRVMAIGVVNPDLKVFCAIKAVKGSRVTEVELADSAYHDTEGFAHHLEKLGAKLTERPFAKGVAKKKTR